VAEEGLVKPRVGVVVVKDGAVIGESYRGETGEGRHAEFGLLDRLKNQDLTGSTVYTTLEPCSRRNHPKVPCAQHLIDARVRCVVIGMYDPNPVIFRQGWRMLRDAGVQLRNFTPSLRSEVRADNAAFIDQYRLAMGMRGSASFDYQQNGGRFLINSGSGPITTRWTQRGATSIYAIDYDGHVALARYAQDFDEIDDPEALDWSNYTVGVDVGEIVAFRSTETYVLVRITQVYAGERGADHTALHFDYETRTIRDREQQAWKSGGG